MTSKAGDLFDLDGGRLISWRMPSASIFFVTTDGTIGW